MQRILPLLMAGMVVLMPATAAHAGRGRSLRDLDSSVCKAIEVDDGDSFSCDGEPIRVLGVDTPEIAHPKHGIATDQEKGREAAAFTSAALAAATRVVVVRGGIDPYKRTLAHVLLDGELLGIKLLRAGLACETVSHYGVNGLPEFALQIREAAATSPAPAFENPHDWRKKHQKRTSKSYAFATIGRGVVMGDKTGFAAFEPCGGTKGKKSKGKSLHYFREPWERATRNPIKL